MMGPRLLRHAGDGCRHRCGENVCQIREEWRGGGGGVARVEQEDGRESQVVLQRLQIHDIDQVEINGVAKQRRRLHHSTHNAAAHSGTHAGGGNVGERGAACDNKASLVWPRGGRVDA